MITRNGIAYDLLNTPYRATIDGIVYHFSSKNHLEKFNEKMVENREVINYSLTKRFSVHVNVNLLADVILYSHVESRGFCIQKDGEIFKCKNSILLNGVTVTKKS